MPVLCFLLVLTTNKSFGQLGITTQPSNSTACSSTTLTFTVNKGTGCNNLGIGANSGISFVWQYSSDGSTGWANVSNGTPIGLSYSPVTTYNGSGAGATATSTFTITLSGSVSVSGYFRCLANQTGTGCTTVITSNTATVVLIPTPPSVSNFSTSAASACTGNNSTVTVTSSSLASAAYTVSYYVDGTNTIASSGTPTTASMTFSSGSGTFTTSSLTNAGSSNVIHITSIIATGTGCSSSTVSSGNTSTFTTTTPPSVSDVTISASTLCVGTGATVTLSSSTLSTATYTITYNVSGTNTVSSTTATMSNFTSGSPGTGTFTTSALSTAGSSNVVNVTGIQIGSCSVSTSKSTPVFTTNAGPTATSFTLSASNIVVGDKGVITVTSTTLVDGTNYTVSYSSNGGSANTVSSTTAVLNYVSTDTWTFVTPTLSNAGTNDFNVASVTVNGCSTILSSKNITFTSSASGTCTSTASANWNVNSTWSCGHVPTATDNVIIATGHSVTLHPNQPNIHDFTIETSGSLTDNNGSPTLNITGNFTLDGTISALSTLFTFSGAGKTFDGTGNIVASNNITITNDKTIVNGSNMVLTGGIIITAGSTVTNLGEITVGGNITGTGTSSSSIWINSSNSTLNIGGASSPPIFNNSTQGILYATATGNTVNYFGVGSAIDIATPNSNTYYNLTITGASNTKSIPNNTTIIVLNDLDISTSNTGAFSCGTGGTLKVRGDWNNNNGATGFSEGSTGTIVFDGSSAQSISCLTNGGAASTEKFYNVQFNNAAGFTINNNTEVQGTLYMASGNITVSAGKTLSVGTSTSFPGTLSYQSGAVIGQFQRWVMALSGTISTDGTTAVTGSGTSFSTQLSKGQLLYTADKVLIGTISVIGSNTSITLASGATGTYSGISYSVFQGTNAGTLSVTSGSKSVTGSGTSFLTEVKAGQVITNSSGVAIGRVATITNDVTLTLDVNSPITVSSGSYKVEAGYNFPVGTASSYRPLFMNISSGYTTGSVVSEFVESFPGNTNLPQTDSGPSQSIGSTFREGYWTLLAANSFALGGSTRFYLTLTGTSFSSHTINNTSRLLTGTNNSANSTPTSWAFNGTHETWSSGSTIARTNMSADISSIKGFAFGDPTNCSTSAVSSRVLAIGGDTNICSVEASGQAYATYIAPTFSGTISTTSGATAVTGSGTSFDTQISDNDVLLTPDGVVIGIVSSAARTSSSLTLTGGASGTYTGIYYLKTTLAGTITTDVGTTTVTGSTTTFTSLSAGDVLLTADGVKIGTVSVNPVSNTSLTLSSNALTTYSGRYIKANKTGNITTNSSNTLVTGSGTSFRTELRPGQSLYTTGGTLIGVISTITDDTNLNLTGNAASTNAGIAYMQIGAAFGTSTYTWTVVGDVGSPSYGTTSSISVNWDTSTPVVATVNVYETTSGCSSDDRTLSVNLQSIIPSDISGNDDVPQNSDGLKNYENYSTTAQAFYTSYIWTVSGGTLYDSQGGTAQTSPWTTTQNSVYVRWDDAGTGTISVQGITVCETSAPTSLNVNIYNLIYTINSGTWNSNQNQADFWSCNCVPTATDNIFIKTGHTVTIAITSAAAKNMIIAGTLNTGSSSQGITVSGNLTFISGTLGGSGALTLTGFNKNIDGTGTLSNTGGININGTQNILSTATLSSTAAASTVTIAAGISAVNNGSFSTAGTIIGSNSASIWTNAAGSTLNVGGNLMATGTLDATGTGNIVNYNGTTAQAVKATQYVNLYFNNTTATGIASPTASSTVSVNGNWINNGATAVGGYTGFNPNSGTVIFNGSTTISGTATSSFNNLTISSSLTAPSGTINVGGAFTNNGSFAHSSGTVNMNGTAAQSITGSNSTTFNNLTLAGTGTPVTFSKITFIDAVLTIATGVKANLSNITAHTAQTLILGSTPQVAGTWGSNASTATNKDGTFFDNAATGIITVASAKYYSIANGNWNSNTTWSFSSGGTAVVAGYPVAGDICVIEGGRIVTLTAAAACTTINFTAATASTLSLNGRTLNVSGSLNIPRTGTGSNTVTVGSGTLNVGTLAFTSAGASSGHTVTVSTGTLKITDDITVNGSGNTSPNITITGAGLMQIGGTIWSNTDGTLSAASGSTVEYNGTSAQTVQAHTYNGHLKLSGGGTKTLLAGTTSIGGDLTLSGTVATTTVASLTIGGNLNVGDGTTFTAAGFPITVTGTTTIGGGASGQLFITSSTGTPKRFTGLVTVASNGIWNNSGNSDVYFSGGITNSGAFTAGSGVHTFDTGSSQSLTGTFTIPSLTITGVTLTNNNTLTIGTALIGTGALTQAASSTLNLGGTATITTLNASNSGNTVNYYGTSNQTMLMPSSSQYVNLAFNGTGSGIAIGPAGTLNVSGNWVNNGVAVSGYNGFNPNGGTINFNGTSTLSGTADTKFNNLAIATTTGNLTASNGILYVAGTFTNNNSFAHGNGTVNFNGATSSSLTGSATSSFNNLTISTPTFTNSNTPKAFSVAGNFVLNGTFNDVTNAGTVTLNGSSAQIISGSAAATFNNLAVTNSSSVTLSSAQNLYGNLSFSTASTFNTGGFLTLLSTSETHAASIGNLTNVTFSGNITAQRYMAAIGGEHFRYIASPVNNVAQPSGLGTFYKYNNAWSKYYGNMLIGEGYATATGSQVTWSVSGSINVGDFDWGVLSQGWHLLGNPYPSSISWSNPSGGSWTANNVSSLVAVTDNSINGYPNYFRYYDYNGANPDFNNDLSPDPALLDDVITRGQSFWVYVGSGGGNLLVKESAKSTTSGKFYRTRTPDIKSQLMVSIDNQKFKDKALLQIVEKKVPEEFDNIPKLWNNQMNVYFLNGEDNELLFHSVPDINDQAKVMLGIQVTEPGNYILSFMPSDVFQLPLYLIDLYEGVSVPVTKEMVYSFVVRNSAKSINDRFYLSRNPEIRKSEIYVTVYPNPVTHKVNIEIKGQSSTVQTWLADVNGKILNSTEFKGEATIDMSEFPAGMFILKVKTSQGLVVQKIMKHDR